MRKKIWLCAVGAFLCFALTATGCGRQGTAAVSESDRVSEGAGDSGSFDEEQTAGPVETMENVLQGDLDFKRLENLKKASLKVSKEGESREETSASKADLERLGQELLKAEKVTEEEANQEWDGILTLETEDQQKTAVEFFAGEKMLLKTAEGDVYQLSPESRDVVLGIFTTLKGWMTYGNKVRLETTEKTMKLEADELVLKLCNETGGPIDYIASPIIYRKMEDGTFQQVESIGGFCGFVSHLDGEETLVKIPWKGMFEVSEPGVYKVEIQAMKEEMRWEISAEFMLEN